MKLTGIIDSGSTKADWVIINENGFEILRTNTAGFNPLLVSPNTIISELNNNTALTGIRKENLDLYFYGAGCKSIHAAETLKNTLNQYFQDSQISVNTDLQGACLAVCRQSPAIVGILGTGSNACFFDGEKAETLIPSLGYILGDEGSGNHIGRELLKAFFYKTMPELLLQKFSAEFQTDLDFVLEQIYQRPKPNAYLARFTAFAAENIDQTFIHQLVYNCLDSFVASMILPYKPTPNIPINFVGSIAYFFKDILQQVLLNRGLKASEIVQKPVDGLVEYHRNSL